MQQRNQSGGWTQIMQLGLSQKKSFGTFGHAFEGLSKRFFVSAD